jgi:hypothetical protein
METIYKQIKLKQKVLKVIKCIITMQYQIDDLQERAVWRRQRETRLRGWKERKKRCERRQTEYF